MPLDSQKSSKSKRIKSFGRTSSSADPDYSLPYNRVDDGEVVLPIAFRGRLYELFSQIEKEFEVLYTENITLKEKIESLNEQLEREPATDRVDGAEGGEPAAVKTKVKRESITASQLSQKIKSTYKLKASTSRIVSTFKTPSLSCRLAKEYLGTSFNKTPKGKNEKRMSFKVAGGGSAVKATPAKTPQRNSLVPKKPLTPAAKSKGPVQQEFEGMKGKQTKRPAQDDDDDEEDVDDDEEDNFDMDDSDAEDDDADDMDEKDDDTDEEDDDKEEENDNDDDNEEEEQHTRKNGKSVIVKLKKQKNAKQTEKLATPKAETSYDSKKAKEERGSRARTVALNPEERKQRDARSLFAKYLPKDVVVEELKKMSPDIQDVFFPAYKYITKTKCAFLQFESEAKAEANHKILGTKTFRGKPLTVDFVREKSERPKQDQPTKKYNMKKLKISSLPPGTSIAQIVEYFPKARYISFDTPVHRCATIGYATETDAAKDFDKAKGVDIKGLKMIVDYDRIFRVKKKNRTLPFLPQNRWA